MEEKKQESKAPYIVAIGGLSIIGMVIVALMGGRRT